MKKFLKKIKKFAWVICLIGVGMVLLALHNTSYHDTNNLVLSGLGLFVIVLWATIIFLPARAKSARSKREALGDIADLADRPDGLDGLRDQLARLQGADDLEVQDLLERLRGQH